MFATSWNPWSFFFTLDYFSRIYFVGLVCVAIWSYSISLRIILGVLSLKARNGNCTDSEYLNLARMNHNLHSALTLGVTFATCCCVNQIFGVWFVYMARVTDANPFLALRDAWMVVQIQMCILVSLDLTRRCISAMLAKACPQPTI
jgi:hypothetical protein